MAKAEEDLRREADMAAACAAAAAVYHAERGGGAGVGTLNNVD